MGGRWPGHGRFLLAFAQIAAFPGLAAWLGGPGAPGWMPDLPGWVGEAGNWQQWYRQAIPRAEQLLEIYLKERAEAEERG